MTHAFPKRRSSDPGLSPRPGRVPSGLPRGHAPELPRGAALLGLGAPAGAGGAAARGSAGGAAGAPLHDDADRAGPPLSLDHDPRGGAGAAAAAGNPRDAAAEDAAIGRRTGR